MLDLPSTVIAADEIFGWLPLCGLAGLWILLHYVRSIVKAREHEMTRREIAAYVAEGSISPEDAVALLATDGGEFEKQLADAVAWGMMSEKKATRLAESLRQAGKGKKPAAAS